MDTPTLSVAKITSDPKPAWREELDPVSVTSAAFEKVTLTAKSCGWIVRASRELVQDAINFSQALTSLFVRVGATELDRAIFAGTGSASPSAEPLGLLSTVGLQEVDAGSAVLTNHDHILDLVGKVLAAHAPFPDAWAAAPQIEIDLAKLKQGTTLAPMPEPPLLGRITNRETTTALSDQTVGSPYGDNSLIVGNFSEVLVGIREQINSRPLIELYAATGEIGFVCHLRADVQVARPKAMGRLINVQTK
jgi:HK97 family phage major capsid protein